MSEMTWHYQLVRQDDYIEVREVYKDGPGPLRSWTSGGITPGGRTKDEAIDDLLRMVKDCCYYDVLEED